MCTLQDSINLFVSLSYNWLRVGEAVFKCVVFIFQRRNVGFCTFYVALPPKIKVIYKCSRNFLKSAGGRDIQNSSVVPAAL